MAEIARGHLETHRGGGAVRDVVIGMSDGLTVPFALAAGISGAIASSGLVVTAGLAEVAAGSIAMGLGGYLAGRSEIEHYESELARERREVVEKTAVEEQEVRDVLKAYGLAPPEAETVVGVMRRHQPFWIDFMMHFELGLNRPERGRELRSALTIGLSYVAGGLLPLVPYMVLGSVQAGLAVSVVVTLVALAVFGYVKGVFTGMPAWKSALQTTVTGGLAAGAAFALARSIS
jgi:vacuolar iron transporter family protein